MFATYSALSTGEKLKEIAMEAKANIETLTESVSVSEISQDTKKARVSILGPVARSKARPKIAIIILLP